MRHRNPARPLFTLVAACLIAAPAALSQAAPDVAPQEAPQTAPQTADVPAAAPAPGASTAAAAPAPAPALGPPAVSISDTPDALARQLQGKTFYLRGFYQDEHLEFDTAGKPSRPMQKGSFALSAVQIDQVKFTKHAIEMKGHRMGLHFFGALPYEDDSKPFELIKVDPKKSVQIDIERLVIEPEKKKKKKDLEKEAAAKALAAKTAATAQTAAGKTDGTSAVAAASPAAPTTVAETTDESSAQETPAQKTSESAAASAPTTTAIATTAPAIAPNHDPRTSFLELSKTLNLIFAPALNDSVIATLPVYWQQYFATKAGRSRAATMDASAMRPGGDVKPPQLLSRIDPTSNEYAQKNNIAGLIFLQTVVSASGQPGEVTIVRPIGFGLDEKAVEAVEHSHFRPGTLNGQPVAEVINLQVTFRIYSNRTKPTGVPAPATPTQVAPRETPKGPPSNAPVVATATVSE